jgi:hypothetical protein
MKSLVASMTVFGVLTFGAIQCTATNSLEGDYDWLSKPNNIQIKMSITEDKFFVSNYDDGWKYRVVEEKDNITKILVYEYNEPAYAKQMILEKKEDGIYVYRQNTSGKFNLIGIANKR